MGIYTENELLRQYEQNERNLELIHESLGEGLWSVEFDKAGEVTGCEFSDTFRRLAGYSNETDFPNALSSWSDLIYSEDKQKVMAAFQGAINDYSGRSHFDVEYRLNTRNKGLRWFHHAGRLIRREDGTPIRFTGLFIDIDDDRAMAARFNEQLEIVEALSREYLNVYRVNVRDRSAVILKQEGYAGSLLNRRNEVYSYDTMTDEYITERVHPADMASLYEALKLENVEKNIYERGEYVGTYRTRVNGEVHFRQFNFVPLSGNPNIIIAGFKNIDSIVSTARERDNLKTLSETDLMTGLLNRGSGEKMASELIETGIRGMLIIFDVDKFKSINDTFGHGIGDKVIIAVADCLRKAFRDGDVVFRLGGDEFSALAVNVDSMTTGRAIIDRLFDRINNINIPELLDRRITVSVCAAMSDGVFTTSFEEMYKKADACVYESKKIKGNAVNFSM